MVAPSNGLYEISFVRSPHHTKIDAARALAASTLRYLYISRMIQLYVNVFQINSIVDKLEFTMIIISLVPGKPWSIRQLASIASSD